MRPTSSLVAVLLATVIIPDAVAQQRPTATPTRDVSVTYRGSGQAGAIGELRMSWLPARNMMRIDMGGGMGWMLMDMQAATAIMVMDAQRMIMNIPAGQIPPGGMAPSPAARFTREGSARIANLDCVNWRVEDRNETARVCLTTEGVMLRAESLSTQAESRGTLEATAVSFGVQDPARFQRPTGYQNLQLPSGLPPGGVQGGQRGTALPPPGVTMPSR